MSQQQTGKIYIQKLQTFAYACLGFPLLFFIYLYLESSVDQLEPKVSEDYHLYIFFALLLLAVLLIILSFKKYQFARASARLKPDFKEKLYFYRKGSNQRFLLYGISTTIITFGFYLTNYQPFAALFGIMIVLFSINNPNDRKIVRELKLKDDEKTIILTGLDIP